MSKDPDIRCETESRVMCDGTAVSMTSLVSGTIDEHLAIVAALKSLESQLADVAKKITLALHNGGKVLWMGNGGSAADSQHLAAELVGRFTRERRGLASIALTTDTSVLTAIANDYSFASIFSRQIEAICNPQDVVIAISTSGNSENVLRAVSAAKNRGAFTVGLTGKGGKIADLVDVCLFVPSGVTARIQEAHILIGHILCDCVESQFV
jgi:D-sedoheptulose 7-phosphate isomerase